MKKQITFQFCLDNYKNNEEFNNRNINFLKEFQDKIGILDNPMISDEFFEICQSDRVFLGDIIPPFLIPIIHEYDLPNYQNAEMLIPIVDQIINDFRSEDFEGNDNQMFGKFTLVLKYNQFGIE
jgi:hypothetical protein